MADRAGERLLIEQAVAEERTRVLDAIEALSISKRWRQFTSPRQAYLAALAHTAEVVRGERV